MSVELQQDDKPGRLLKLLPIWYSVGAILLFGVAIVSLLPAPDTGVNDKLGHLLTYALLAGWFAVISTNRRVLACSIAGLVGYGILIELLQAQTGYRQAEVADALANALGCVPGGLLYLSPLNRYLQRLDAWLFLRLRG